MSIEGAQVFDFPEVPRLLVELEHDVKEAWAFLEERKSAIEAARKEVHGGLVNAEYLPAAISGLKQGCEWGNKAIEALRADPRDESALKLAKDAKTRIHAFTGLVNEYLGNREI